MTMKSLNEKQTYIHTNKQSSKPSKLSDSIAAVSEYAPNCVARKSKTFQKDFLPCLVQF